MAGWKGEVITSRVGIKWTYESRNGEAFPKLIQGPAAVSGRLWVIGYRSTFRSAKGRSCPCPYSCSSRRHCPSQPRCSQKTRTFKGHEMTNSKLQQHSMNSKDCETPL